MGSYASFKWVWYTLTLVSNSCLIKLDQLKCLTALQHLAFHHKALYVVIESFPCWVRHVLMLVVYYCIYTIWLLLRRSVWGLPRRTWWLLGFVSSVSCLWRTSAFTFPLLDTRCVRIKPIGHVINVSYSLYAFTLCFWYSLRQRMCVTVGVKSAPHAKHTTSRISWLNTRGLSIRIRKCASQFSLKLTKEEKG
jgi:hypothetical protein